MQKWVLMKSVSRGMCQERVFGETGADDSVTFLLVDDWGSLNLALKNSLECNSAIVTTSLSNIMRVKRL